MLINLGDSVSMVEQLRNDKDDVENRAVEDDPNLHEVHNKVKELTQLRDRALEELKKYSDKTDTADDGDTYGIEVLIKRLEEVEKKYAEISETLELKRKCDILKSILHLTKTRARERLAKKICNESNERIKTLMPNNDIVIDGIERSLKLSGQDAGSVGETLSVGYAFLTTLFNRSEHSMPFVVDSPANPIDLEVRSQVAQLIPYLSEQFVGFTISSERRGFIEVLAKMRNIDIQYLTLFRKGVPEYEGRARKKKQSLNESSDGMLVNDLQFFMDFHILDED